MLPSDPNPPFQRKLDVARSAENVRMDGPGGVSKANHPVPFSLKVAGFQLSWNDEQEIPAIESLEFGAWMPLPKGEGLMQA